MLNQYNRLTRLLPRSFVRSARLLTSSTLDHFQTGSQGFQALDTRSIGAARIIRRKSIFWAGLWPSKPYTSDKGCIGPQSWESSIGITISTPYCHMQSPVIPETEVCCTHKASYDRLHFCRKSDEGGRSMPLSLRHSHDLSLSHCEVDD